MNTKGHESGALTLRLTDTPSIAPPPFVSIRVYSCLFVSIRGSIHVLRLRAADRLHPLPGVMNGFGVGGFGGITASGPWIALRTALGRRGYPRAASGKLCCFSPSAPGKKSARRTG